MKAIRSNAIVMEALVMFAAMFVGTSGFVWVHMRFGRLAGVVAFAVLMGGSQLVGLNMVIARMPWPTVRHAQIMQAVISLVIVLMSFWLGWSLWVEG
jgi:hypothetical protein